MKENDLVRFRIEEKEKCRKELELSKKEVRKDGAMHFFTLSHCF